MTTFFDDAGIANAEGVARVGGLPIFFDDARTGNDKGVARVGGLPIFFDDARTGNDKGVASVCGLYRKHADILAIADIVIRLISF